MKDNKGEMNISDKVKEIRRKSGLSQVKFAKKHNIPRRTLEDWESGASKPPRYVIELLYKVEEYEKNRE